MGTHFKHKKYKKNCIDYMKYFLISVKSAVFEEKNITLLFWAENAPFPHFQNGNLRLGHHPHREISSNFKKFLIFMNFYLKIVI